MKQSIALVIASLGLAGLALGGIASCKQGEGERCQVQADCEDELTCTGEKICASSNNNQIDAPPPVDAPPQMDAPDAPPI